MITFNELGQYGRFGNQLFQIASTIGHAKKHKYSYGFPEWKERKYFKNYLPLCVNKLKTFKVPFMHKEFITSDNVSLLGYMMSPKYFEHCQDLIKYYFEMKTIKGLPKIKTNSIAIHVRAGDYGTIHFPRLKAEYYKNALSLLPELPVYVFSDEIETAKKIFKGYNFEYIETNNYIYDFYLMQQCKHFIIANSTFSWWAAYLGKHKDKIVIAPDVWFGGAMKIYTNNIYCKNWTII